MQQLLGAELFLGPTPLFDKEQVREYNTAIVGPALKLDHSLGLPVL